MKTYNSAGYQSSLQQVGTSTTRNNLANEIKEAEEVHIVVGINTASWTKRRLSFYRQALQNTMGYHTYSPNGNGHSAYVKVDFSEGTYSFYLDSAHGTYTPSQLVLLEVTIVKYGI